jgi:pyruvate dehydrogenase E1 component alpha subunit
VKAWLARDPIPAYRERLLAAGVEAGTIDRVEREALELVDRATEEAKAGPFPDPGALETELWADGGSSWRS